MSEKRARSRLIERLLELPFTECLCTKSPFICIRPQTSSEASCDAAHRQNNARLNALTEIGDYNRAHPATPITTQEIDDAAAAATSTHRSTP